MEYKPLVVYGKLNNGAFVKIIDLTPYIIRDSFTVGSYKQWGSDAGRSTLNGTYSGTLIGIFPKLSFTLRRLKDNEATTVYDVFDNAYGYFQYYDRKGTRIKQFYIGDVIDKIESAISLMHSQTDIDIVAVSKKDY